VITQIIRELFDIKIRELPEQIIQMFFLVIFLSMNYVSLYYFQNIQTVQSNCFINTAFFMLFSFYLIAEKIFPKLKGFFLLSGSFYIISVVEFAVTGQPGIFNIIGFFIFLFCFIFYVFKIVYFYRKDRLDEVIS